MIKFLTILLSLATLSLVACDKAEQANDNSAPLIQHEVSKLVIPETSTPSEPVGLGGCVIPADAFNNLPTTVLSGSDTLEIKDFTPAEIRYGAFASESNAAKLHVMLTRTNTAGLANRSFTQADDKLSRHLHENLCVQNHFIYGDGLRAQATNAGLLWLELNNRDSSISSDSWTLLTPAK